MSQIPEDVKNWRANNGFVLFTEGEAIAILMILVFGAFVVDLARQLIAWMFS